MDISKLQCKCKSAPTVLFGVKCCTKCKISYAYSVEEIKSLYNSAQKAYNDLCAEKRVKDLVAKQFIPNIQESDKRQLVLLKQMSEILGFIEKMLQETKNYIDPSLRNPLNKEVYNFIIALNNLATEYNLSVAN